MFAVLIAKYFFFLLIIEDIADFFSGGNCRDCWFMWRLMSQKFRQMVYCLF